MTTFEEILNSQEKNEILDITGAFGDIQTCEKLFAYYYKQSLTSEFYWVDEYARVVEWMKTNIVNGKNKGLLLSLTKIS